MAKKSASDQVSVRLGSYITLPQEAIVRALLAKLPGEKDQMRLIDFARRLEGLYRVRIAERAKPLRRSFDLFMSKGHSHELVASASAATEEDFFLERLHETLVKCNFVLLDQTEYTDALNSEYVLNVDLKLHRERLDCTLIERLHAKHASEAEFQAAASITRDILVYHRGVGQDTISGLFVAEKIDFLLGEALGGLWWLLLGFVAVLKVWRWPAYVRAHVQALHTVEVPQASTDATSTSYRNVERVSLQSTLKASWTNLFRKIALKEPTFKELVIVYRTKEQLDAQKPGQPAEITVKSFKDVPKGDFEVILPAQSFVTRSGDFVKLAVALVAAVGVMVSLALSNDDDKDGVVDDFGQSAKTLLTAFGSYIVKIGMQFKAAQARYQNVSNKYLYDKAMDSGHGVRAYILESNVQQELKEALLAYFFLWQNIAGNLMELDSECESFLRGLGDEADFEVEDALLKLMLDGFVSGDGTRLSPTSDLRTLTMSRAIVKLDALWKEYFSSQDLECPYCQYLHDHTPAVAEAAGATSASKLD